MKTAALIYFNDGTTMAQARAVIQAVQKQLQRGEFQSRRRAVNHCRIEHVTVDEYDPDIGGPVWYIP